MSSPAFSDPTAALASTGSSTGPTAHAAPMSPPPTRATLPAIALSAFTLFATYGGLIAILLPSQILLLNEADKVKNLGIVMTASFVFTLFAQPIVGALSDRTRSRLGRRSTWMLLGAFVGGVLLLAMGSLKSLLLITVSWVIIQVALNAIQGPLSAVIPDRFPREKRGGASAVFGVGMQLGGTIGVITAGGLATRLGLPLTYATFGVIVMGVTVIFVLINRDWSSKDAAVDPWSWVEFLKGFWVSPQRYPDFAWAFAARFLLMLGYWVVMAYQLYLLTDYIGMTLEKAQSAVITLTLVAFVPTLVAIALSGWWSDKIGRRKIFIYAASALMAVGMTMPILMPTMTGMIAMSVINGFGFGLYMSVDTALMTEVLPGGGTAAGKDLGILNIATNVPQAMSPAIAGIIITSLGGYAILFVFAIIFAIIAAFVVIPIKSVR